MPTRMSHWIIGTMFGLSLAVGAAGVTRADEDEDNYWGGYWKWYDGAYRPYYNRPRPLLYGSSSGPLYYGHAPPRTYSYSRVAPHIEPRGKIPYPSAGGETRGGISGPFLGPGHYYGPPIAPYYAPGQDRYGGMKYGWW